MMKVELVAVAEAEYLSMTKVEVEVDAEWGLQQVQGQADNHFIPFSADPDEWEILDLQFSYFNFILKFW